MKKSRQKPQILILAGDGINCERETAKAIEMALGRPHILHINDLLSHPSQLKRFQAMVIPGGFSFGDELGAGKILSLKLKYGLEETFFSFIDQGRPLLGICNGFQVLIQLGVLPWKSDHPPLSLTHNQQNTFINRWVPLRVPSESRCLWTKDMEELFSLPIRHAQGRLVFPREHERPLYQKLKDSGHIALEYTEDVNGSYKRIAGLCDPTGLILGLMPHPEVAVLKSTYPTREGRTPGRTLFSNMVSYIHQS